MKFLNIMQHCAAKKYDKVIAKLFSSQKMLHKKK